MQRVLSQKCTKPGYVTMWDLRLSRRSVEMFPLLGRCAAQLPTHLRRATSKKSDEIYCIAFCALLYKLQRVMKDLLVCRFSFRNVFTYSDIFQYWGSTLEFVWNFYSWFFPGQNNSKFIRSWYIYIYIYIYMCVCVCVCVCARASKYGRRRYYGISSGEDEENHGKR